MSKDVRRETTVTYRCDGCGQEDVKIDEYVQEHILPLGWGGLLFVDGVEPHLQTEGAVVSSGVTHYVARSSKPFRNILICHLCSKKLADFFKTKDEVPPKTTKKRSWWQRLLNL